MITSEAKILIKQSAESLWPLVGSPLRMVEYHPLFTDSKQLAGGGTATGDRLRWHFQVKKRTGYYDEEIVQVVPNKLIQLENRGGKNIPPFSQAITTIRLEDNGDQTTTTTFNVQIAFKSRLLQSLLGWQVKRGYRKFLPKILEALKIYSENGTA